MDALRMEGVHGKKEKTCSTFSVALGFASAILLGFWLDRKDGVVATEPEKATDDSTSGSSSRSAASIRSNSTDAENAASEPMAADNATGEKSVLELSSDGLPLADVPPEEPSESETPAPPVNRKRIAAVLVAVLGVIWKVVVWLFKNGWKSARTCVPTVADPPLRWRNDEKQCTKRIR